MNETLIPDGEYKAYIEVDVHAKVIATITEGPFSGRKIYAQYYIDKCPFEINSKKLGVITVGSRTRP